MGIHDRRETVTPGLLVANSKLDLSGGHCKVGRGDLEQEEDKEAVERLVKKTIQTNQRSVQLRP